MGTKIKKMPVPAVFQAMFRSPSRNVRICIMSVCLLASIPDVTGDGFVMQDDILPLVDVANGQIWVITP